MSTINDSAVVKDGTVVKKVTVLGAGVLGSQIAYQCAFAGFQVVNYDVNDDALTSAQQRYEKIASVYEANIAQATTEQLNATGQRLQQSKDLAQAVSEADLIIEAVPESLELKQQVWAEVGKHAPSHCIFTTNTSSLLPSMFASASGDTSRFLALHFANDIWRQRIVEVMGTAETDSQIVEQTMQFATDMGMIPIHVKKEQPGYIMNSLLIPLLTSACRLYTNEVSEPSDIDKVWKLATGSPKGPFEILDIIGLRTVYAVYSARAKTSEDPSMEKFANIIKNEFLAKGRNGRESGGGFYDYDEQGNIKS